MGRVRIARYSYLPSQKQLSLAEHSHMWSDLGGLVKGMAPCHSWGPAPHRHCAAQQRAGHGTRLILACRRGAGWQNRFKMMTVTPLVVFKGWEWWEQSIFPPSLAPHLPLRCFSFLPSVIPCSSISAHTTAPSLYNSSSCGHYPLDYVILLGCSVGQVGFGHRKHMVRCIARPKTSGSGAEMVTAKLLGLKRCCKWYKSYCFKAENCFQAFSVVWQTLHVTGWLLPMWHFTKDNIAVKVERNERGRLLVLAAPGGCHCHSQRLNSEKKYHPVKHLPLQKVREVV